MTTTFNMHCFNVLGTCLGVGWEYKSLEDLIERMGGRFTRSHFAKTVGEVWEEIFRKPFHYDVVFMLHRTRPECTAAGSNGSFPQMEGMNVGEAMALAILHQHPHVKIIMFMDGADNRSLAFERSLAPYKERIYFPINQPLDWAQHFVDSHLFDDHIARFGGIPETVGA